MMEQQDVYEVAQRAAQRFMQGEIYYQDAIDSVVDTFSPEYVRENYWAAQTAAEDLIDEQLLELERAALDATGVYRAAEEAAQDFTNGSIDYHQAVYRVRSMFPPTYVRRNPDAAQRAAQDLIDEALNRIKISSG